MTSQYLPIHSLGKDISVSANSIFTSDGDVLEISADRSRVFWRSELKEFTRLSITPSKTFGPILGAVWTTFGKSRCICILQSE